MSKFLKICIYLIIALLVINSVVYLYIFREQEIDVALIPNEFTYCGMKINASNSSYQEIVSWLKENNEGWVTSFVTFIPKQVYQANAFQVNVMENLVVVSYKSDYGYSQFIKKGKHQLSKQCQ